MGFLYPNTGEGRLIRLHGEAVYCLRRFRDVIADMTETAWARSVRRLKQDQALIGQGPDLWELVFGCDRTVLGVGLDARWRDVLGG